MTIIKPSPGEKPWNAKMDAILDGFDAALTALPVTYVPKPQVTAPASPSVGHTWLSSSLADMVISPAPGDRRAVLTASQGFEAASMQEISVWYSNGVYNAVYTTGPSATCVLGYASAPHPMGPWTKHTSAVLGNGAGGFANTLQHGNVYIEGNNGWYYFADTTGGNVVLKVATATSADWKAWTVSGTTYALPGGSTQWGNTFVFKEADNTYTMMLETLTGSGWQMSLGTLGSSPTGALTVTQATMPTIRPSAPNSVAATSGAFLLKEGSTYVLYYHAAPYGSLPTDIYRATSTDKVTWVIDNGGLPIVRRAATKEVDQVADPWLIQTPGGQWYMFWEGVDNTVTPIAATVYCAPLLPVARQWDGTVWTRTNPAPVSPGSTTPQKSAFKALATDVAVTTTASFTTVVSVQFAPTGTTAIVDVTARFSMASTSSAILQVSNGANLYPLGTIAMGSNVQAPFAGKVKITGLSPGQPYTFNVGIKCGSAVTLNCRPAAFPASEGIEVEARDCWAY